MANPEAKTIWTEFNSWIDSVVQGFGMNDIEAITARARYKNKTWINVVILYAIYAVLICILYGLILGGFGKFLATIFSISFVSFLFTQWTKKPIRLRCDNAECGKMILSNTPWTCGFCAKENRNASSRSFLGKCGECGDEPKAYQCHHCDELIFLTEDKITINYARCIHAPAKITTEDLRAFKRHERDEERDSMEHKLLMAELTERIDGVEKRKAAGKKKSPKDVIKESFESAEAHKMEVRNTANAARARYRKEHKNNPDELARTLEFVDDWERSMLS